MPFNRPSEPAKKRPSEQSLPVSTASTTVKLIEALAELHELLEQYAPSWYTQEHREKTIAALQMAEKVRTAI